MAEEWMEATLISSQVSVELLELQLNCGEITWDKQLNTSEREDLNLRQTEESASALTD